MNAVGLKDKQGRAFRFLNRNKEPYRWTDKVPKDDPQFQGLFEDDEGEAAAYPDISTKLPGVELKSKEDDYTAITEGPAADFYNLAAAVLDNAGIDTVAWLRTARDLADPASAIPWNPTAALVESEEDRMSTRSHSICWMLGLSQALYPTFHQFHQQTPAR